MVDRFIAALLGLVLLGASLPPSAAADKPNILFIGIDDQNDWIGTVGGHPMAKTPHIDALAERGVNFLNAHCNAPLCNPSRTSMMLGLRPTTTGIYGLAPWCRTLPEWKDRVTIAQYFAEHGYRTLGAGKIFNMTEDPNEWHNLAGEELYAEVIAEHRRWIPEVQLDPAPGSAHRILTYDADKDEALWENRMTIKRGDPIPE
jgi:arylsulfatase A-like enzyme